MNMNQDPNPVKNIINPELHEARWQAFLDKAGQLGRAAYKKDYITPSQFGRAMHDLKYGRVHRTSDYLMLACFAYDLHLTAPTFRAKATAHVALHFPRKGIFDLLLGSEYGFAPSTMPDSAYYEIKQHFDAWLGTFGPSVLNQKEDA